MNNFATIAGLEECCADLRRLPPAVCGVAVTRGLNAAGEVIERAIDFKTPTRVKRVGGDAKYPSLITRLEVRIALDSQFRGGRAEIGFFGYGSAIAEWVEFGHRIIAHGKASKEARTKAWLAAGEQSVPADPFIRTAADASEEPAVEAFIEAVNDTLAEFSSSEAA